MSLFFRLLVPAGAVAAVVLLAILLKPEPRSTVVTEPSSVAQAPAAGAPVVGAAPQGQISVEQPSRKIAPRSSPVTYSFGGRTDRVKATSVADPVAAVPFEPSGDESARADREVFSRITPIAVPSITIRPIEVKEIK